MICESPPITTVSEQVAKPIVPMPFNYVEFLQRAKKSSKSSIDLTVPEFNALPNLVGRCQIRAQETSGDFGQCHIYLHSQ